MRKPQGTVVVNARYCAGCSICVAYCPQGVLDLSEELNQKGLQVVRATKPEECTACRLCELYCPHFAIAIVEMEAERDAV